MIDVLRDYVQADKKSPEQLLAFFSKYTHFSTTDLAAILGLSVGHVRRLKGRSGLRLGARPNVEERLRKPRKATIDDILPFEDTPEWWTIHAQKYGMTKLMRASGYGRTATRKRMAKYAPAKRIGKISHPCCTWDWLNKHYTVQNSTLEQCGDLAGVAHETITNWLIIHKIPLRHRRHSSCI